jgi:hypothetical protein
LQDPISKIAKAKWARGVAPAVQHLLCKWEDLSSNPSPTKKKNKTPISKIAIAKRVGTWLKWQSNLPSKHKTLSSNPRTVKKREILISGLIM